MREENKQVTKIGARNWFVLVILGLAGQLAWNVENSWFNTFVYDTLTRDPKPIAWMVAISAITATLTTLFMGAYSDRIGKRKPFIIIGYILWGISTILFPTTAYIKNINLAVALVIIADGIMTFFGSTAYDAAYNAWTTDISDESNRGRISGVITILPLLATIIGAGLSGMIIDEFGYYYFFYALGALVSIIGIVGAFILKEPSNKVKDYKNGEVGLLKGIIGAFSPKSIRANKELYLVLITLALYSISVQVFIPYQMIYINNYLAYSKGDAGIISAAALIIAMIFAYPAGILTDKGHGLKLAIAAPIISFIGFMGFSFSRGFFIVIFFSVIIYIGYVIFILTTGAWVKNLIPGGSRGLYEGVRMIFSVAIPMIIGPNIGSQLILSYGNDGVPTPIIVQVAGAIGLLALLPLIYIHFSRRGGSIDEKAKG
ncbi:MFS transporter [Alloiococcus sp. CFN-8]|uniref:MFS transporter n=1 Tax=Alloiococcus sp. CFN-8 TaxID=3416081 RepID=UPI003CF78339